MPLILPGEGRGDKCTLCYHRITKGLKPACFEICPTGARMYGDLRDKDGALVKFIKDHNCKVLKPTPEYRDPSCFIMLNAGGQIIWIQQFTHLYEILSKVQGFIYPNESNFTGAC